MESAMERAERRSNRPDLKPFECRRCGRCCLEFGAELPATEQDIARWRAAERWDILDHVASIGLGDYMIYELWFSPRTGEKMSVAAKGPRQGQILLPHI